MTLAICTAAQGLTKPIEGYIGNVLQNTSIAFIIILTIFTALRCLARYQTKAKWGWEDYMVIGAWFTNVGMCAVGIAMVKYGGTGEHLMNVCMTDEEKLKTYARLLLPFSLFLNFGVGLGKIAILGLFLRIFIQKRYVYTTYALIAIQVAAMIAAIVVSCVLCLPLTHLVAPEESPNGHCINVPIFWQYGNIPQAVTDFIILILPFPALLKLKLSTRNKIGVLLTMMTGSVGLVVSIVRPAISEKLMSDGDLTYQGAKFGCLSIGECGAYLIAACLPTYRTLFRFFSKPKTVQTYGSNSLEMKSGSKKSQYSKYGTNFSVATHKSVDEEELVAPSPNPGGIHVQRGYQVL